VIFLLLLFCQQLLLMIAMMMMNWLSGFIEPGVAATTRHKTQNNDNL